MACTPNSTLLREEDLSYFIGASSPTTSLLEGCYLHYDNKNKKWVRSGKVVGLNTNFATRQKQHIQGSKNKYTNNKFYSTYPNYKILNGNINHSHNSAWSDLTQYCGIGFQRSNCDEIVGRKEEGSPSNRTGLDTVSIEYGCIFDWDEYTLSCLQSTNREKNIVEKQLNMVGYLIELVYDLMISPHSNVSESSGFESFLGSFSRR